MIVNAKPSNSLVKTPNIKEVTQDYSTSDYGLIGSNVAAAQNAWNHGLTGTAVEWVYHHMLPYLKPSPLVTKEYYDNTFASEVGIEYNPSKTQAQLDYQIKVAGQDRAIQQQILGKNRTISQTATSFGVGFVDPINVGLMVASAGTGIARNAYASANLAAQAGKPYLSAFHTTRGGLQNYLALSAPAEYIYATAYQDTGINDYTHDMLQMGATNSLLFGLGMSGLNFPKHVRTATEIKTRQSNDAIYRNRMDGTYKEYYNQYDPETTTPVTRTVGDNKVVDILQNIDVAADPHIRSLIDNNPRLKQIAERKLTEKDLTAQDVYDVASVLHQHETHVLLREISGELAKEFRAKEGSIVVNEVEYRATVKRITDSILKGDTSKLTKADIEFLRERFGLLIATEPSTSTQRTVVPEVGLVSYASRNMRAESKATTAPSVEGMQRRVGLAKSHETEYRQLVADISSLVNKIVLGKDVVPVKVGDVDLEAVLTQRPLGSSRFGELGIEIADVYTMFDGDQTSGVGSQMASRVLTTVVHETFHQLQDLNPKMYAQIEKLIESTPKLRQILLDEIKRSGYEKGAYFEFDLAKFPWVENIYPQFVLGDVALVPKTQVEKVPLLMEWYITRPEFHSTAKKKSPNLYKKLVSLLKGALEKAIEFLRIKRSKFFKDMDNFEKADDVAASLKKILQGLREEGSLPNQLKLLKQGITSNEHLSANSQKAYKPAYENPNFEARTRELDRQNANNIEYLEKRIADIVGDEALVPSLLSLPKQSKGETGRQEYIAKLIDTLEQNGLGHVVPAVDTIVRNLQGSASRKAKVTKALRKNDSLVGNTALMNDLREAGAPSEVTSRIGFILLNEDLSTGEKIGKVSQYLAEEDRAMVLRMLHNKTVEQSLISKLDGIKLKKDKLKQLKTILDGSVRKGVELGPSVQRRIEAQIIKDQSPIIEYLVNNDMLELFLGDDPTKYMSSYFDKNFTSEQSKKLYGDKLEQASLAFHMDIMQSILDGETTAKLKDIEEFENFIQIVKNTNRGQLAEINRLGVNIRESKAFTGYSVSYSREVVKDMGAKEFYEYMIKVMDPVQTAKNHGGVMEDAKNNRVVEFDPHTFIKDMYKAVVAGEYEFEDVNTPNKSIAGVLRKSAKIAYKPQYKVEALVRFSNFKNLGRLLLDQIRGRSEKIALIKSLGHDPYQTLRSVVARQALTRTPGFKTFDMTAKQVTGMLDNPVDVAIASSFQKIRQGSNILYLAGSGASALSDIPLTINTLQYLNADFTFKTFVDSYRQAIETQFKGKNKEMAAWYRSQGAGFDLLTRTIAQRVVTGEQIDGGMFGKANQFLFEINGLNRITATHQQLFIDILSSSLADAVRGNGNSRLLSHLRSYGFTTPEIAKLAKHVEKTPDGIDRLAPSSVTNAKLQAKLQAFYLQNMKEAVMEPDVGAQALSRLGLEAGTYAGEAARTAFQYSSFMLGMARVVYRRFLNGYDGDSKHNAFKMAHLVTYLGMAIAFAYMTTIMKDLSKFREPINPFNMTQFDFIRILKQSGITTIGELGIDTAMFGPSEIFSPVTGQAIDLVSGNFAEGLEPFTGQQYPILGPVLEKAVGFVAGETMLNIQKDQLDKADDAKMEE
jgi:hypothetical protein